MRNTTTEQLGRKAPSTFRARLFVIRKAAAGPVARRFSRTCQHPLSFAESSQRTPWNIAQTTYNNSIFVKSLAGLGGGVTCSVSRHTSLSLGTRSRFHVTPLCLLGHTSLSLLCHTSPSHVTPLCLLARALGPIAPSRTRRSSRIAAPSPRRVGNASGAPWILLEPLLSSEHLLPLAGDGDLLGEDEINAKASEPGRARRVPRLLLLSSRFVRRTTRTGTESAGERTDGRTSLRNQRRGGWLFGMDGWMNGWMDGRMSAPHVLST